MMVALCETSRMEVVNNSGKSCDWLPLGNHCFLEDIAFVS